jgi:hypothetical protein
VYEQAEVPLIGVSPSQSVRLAAVPVGEAQ